MKNMDEIEKKISKAVENMQKQKEQENIRV